MIMKKQNPPILKQEPPSVDESSEEDDDDDDEDDEEINHRSNRKNNHNQNGQMLMNKTHLDAKSGLHSPVSTHSFDLQVRSRLKSRNYLNICKHPSLV